jgi:hypothetical protein
LSDAIVVFSRDPEIDAFVSRIPVYPEHERAEKIMSFVSQLPVHLAYLELGEYRRNLHPLAETAVQIVLFGGRLILTHNRIRYPGRKQFVRSLEHAVANPEPLLDLATELLERPSIANARAFVGAVERFSSWPELPECRWARVVRDVERRRQSNFVPCTIS